MSSPQWIHYFTDPPPAGVYDLKALLGGKGASLKDMSRAGLRVPPGFTITTECCARYFADGRKWPEGLEQEVRTNLARLEADAKRTFGRGAKPLLVSVRSGAAMSMPGMMDTLLNCGLTPALAAEVGDTPAFWQLYLEFVRMFAKTVHGLDAAALAEAIPRRGGQPALDHNAPPDRASVEAHLAAYRKLTGGHFPTEPWDALAQCINAVFESWENERAIAYRKRNDIRGLSGTAVTVQMMFPSEVSGIVFTQDPNDLRAERMIIEASYGLGESVVSGDVTPDRFLVSRKDFATKAEIGHKHCHTSALGGRAAFDPNAASLNPAQVRELAELVLKVEKHFGHPLDVEFGWADGQFALLQSRRIRGLEIVQDMELGREEEIFRLRSMADGRRRCWVVHNLAETLRAPTPMTWDVMRQFMGGEGGFGRLYRDLGYRPSARIRREGFLELICGRIYADPERLAELFWEAMPMSYDPEAVVRDPSLIEQPPTRFDPNRADGRFLAHLPGTLMAMIRSGRRVKRARASAVERFEKQILPPYLEYVRQQRERDLGSLTDVEVIAEFRDRRRRVMDEFGPESLKPGFFGGVAFAAVEALLGQLMGEQQGSDLARTLTQALEGDTTMAQNAMLSDVAAGRASMDEFLAQFGHRCVGEMELAVPRWREDPTYPKQAVGRLAKGTGRTPADVHHENLAARRRAEASLEETLARWGGSSFRERLAADLADAQALLPYRESGKHYLMMGYALLRQCLEILADRWCLGGAIYFLQENELDAYAASAGADHDALTEKMVSRRIRWQALQRLDLPDVIDSLNLDGLGLVAELVASDQYTGTAVASGAATAIAVVVQSPEAAGELGPEYVLVCPSTDPGWAPLLAGARGLVVERGGVLSHGAIVARDFGIPAVVCPNATRLLHTGDRIRVDGNTGRIDVVQRAERQAANA